MLSFPRRKTRPAPRSAAPSARPRLEALEHRWVPSTLTVTSIADKGAGSLRADIAAAQSGDTINFAPSLFNNGPQTITLTRGELLLNKNLTIAGPGADELTISGDKAYPSRVFEVASGAQVSLSGMTISDGQAVNGGGILVDAGAGLTLGNSTLSGNSATNSKHNYYAAFGGGIENYGTLSVSNSILSNNTSTDDGGGIDNNGTATVSNCTLTNNASHGGGGGIFNHATLTVDSDSVVSGNSNGGISNAGTAKISDSTLSGNDGSAIYNFDIGTVKVCDSLISGNSATEGGGIYNEGAATLINCTLSDNSASEYGGAIYLSSNSSGSGTLNLSGCTLSGNYTHITYSSGGGGIYITAGAATISGCTLSDNSTAGLGGGICLYGGFGATLTITGSTLTGNSAQYGGGIYIGSGAAVSLDTFTVANIVNNTDNSGLNGLTANIDGSYTPI